MTNRRRVRYAVVGLGHLSQMAVLPGFATAPGSECAALVSGDRRKLTALGRKYGVQGLYSYDDYDRCLESVEAVYIVLPNHLHRDYAVRALNAGVHVLVEKPMAVTSAECRDMIAAARRHDCKLMVAYRLHFERTNLEAIRVAQEGELGELRIFSSEFSQQVTPGNVRVTEPVRRGGGPVYDMGVYCINAARYLFRAEPTLVLAVSASGPGARFKKAEEMTSVMMRFPGERLATFTASFGAADFDRYTLIGTGGSLIADPAYGYHQQLRLEVRRGEKQTRGRSFVQRDHFAAEIGYFSRCILDDKTPEPSGEEGLADVRIIEAIYRSLKRGRPVRLPGTTRRSSDTS